MLALYQPILIREATQADNRSHYRQMATKLKNLLKIEGGREMVVALLEKFQNEYIRRPAMIDEFKQSLIGFKTPKINFPENNHHKLSIFALRTCKILIRSIKCSNVQPIMNFFDV